MQMARPYAPYMLVGCMLCPCAAALGLQQSAREQLLNMIDISPKGDVKKIVFFAGVEGSGHHLLQSITPHLDMCMLGFAHRSWRCGVTWRREGVDIFVNQLKSLEGSCVYLLPQHMSYPMCLGDHETRMDLFYPRLDWIHEAVQQVDGVELHVLQIYRDMDDSLAADCLHRHFEPCDKQADTLVSNGAKLAEHLRLLKPNEKSCFQYGEPEVMAKAVEDVFGAEYKHVVEDIYREHPSQGMRDKVPRWADYVSMLHDTQELLRDECRKSAPVSMGRFLNLTLLTQSD